MIDAYIRAIEEAIASLGKLVRNSSIYNEEREANFIILRGEIKFADNSQLHFREFVQLQEGQTPKRYKYAYHFQRADETMIFRHDNAKHYPHLPSAPHHKHAGENEIVAADVPDLQTVLKEIEGLIRL
jgi:hypothetical protein